ncbi:hypothetical protein ACFWWM_04675 [Streptomyces sp. NPDC058682]|uniref:hypothetical protein n=1 Tax=Streptomyces sp. NPDC058682 TaxID=3346596 RepID=UPI00364D8FB3
MQGRICAIFALCRPAAYSSWIRLTRSTARSGKFRGFLGNPDFVERLRTGAPLHEIRPEFLMHVQGAEGYTGYPALGRSAYEGESAWPQVREQSTSR